MAEVLAFIINPPGRLVATRGPGGGQGRSGFGRVAATAGHARTARGGARLPFSRGPVRRRGRLGSVRASSLFFTLLFLMKTQF